NECKKSETRLVVKTGKVSEVIKPKNVLWIEAQDYYSVLHLNGRQSWIKMTMKELEKTLEPDAFVRIHRSTIININHLKQIKTESSGKYSAIMIDGKKRPISRQGWRDLKKILKTPK
ncbi:MAG: LytTR family DNA-binding domain-containing protein, partial [Alphaproteobacteria bacterium]